jgi:NTE family protein
MMKADGVFEGGGVKGIGFAGALAVAEQRSVEWQNLAGTSAGAIVAALVAAGYKAGELHDVLSALDYRRFKDPTPVDAIPLAGKVVSLVTQKGIYQGDYFHDWLAGLLKAKGITTFGDLVMPGETEARYRFKLNVVASDITLGKLLVLPGDIVDYGGKPEDLNVADAVRMSMSIPFFYEPVMLKNLKTGHNSYIVDGGILSNYPVWLFDSAGAPSWPTIGFKLVEPNSGEPANIKGPVSLLGALFSAMMEAHDERYIADHDFVRTVAIPTLGVRTTEFDISKERSEALYQSGHDAAEKFFRTWDFEQYVKLYRTGQEEPSRGAMLRAAGTSKG